jgi:hypothetical protein
MAKAKTVDEYVGGLDGWKAAVVAALRKIINEAALDAAESIKWAQPVYEVNGPFCFIKAHKAHVNFGFWRGRSSVNGKELIESGGQKMGHVKLRSPADLKPAVFTRMVREAVRLNGAKGNPALGA